MFEVSLVELAVIGLVALLVLGPEKLPRAARTAGLYVRKARATWHAIRSEIERELATEDLKRAAQDTERRLLEGRGMTPPSMPAEKPTGETTALSTETGHTPPERH